MIFLGTFLGPYLNVSLGLNVPRAQVGLITNVSLGTKLSLGTKVTLETKVFLGTKVSLGTVPREKVSFVPKGFGTVGEG